MASTSSSGIVITVIPICILLLSSLLTVQTISGSWIPIATNILCLLLGAAATTVLKFMLFRIYKYLAPRSNHGHSPDIYGLDHGRLNITLPPQTMWMNMGYWKVCNSISLSKSVPQIRSGATTPSSLILCVRTPPTSLQHAKVFYLKYSRLPSCCRQKFDAFPGIVSKLSACLTWVLVAEIKLIYC